MYRILVNVNNKPSSRLVVDNIKRLDDIAELFLMIETGKIYEMSPSVTYTVNDYTDWLDQGEEVTLEYETTDNMRVLLRIKRIRGIKW